MLQEPFVGDDDIVFMVSVLYLELVQKRLDEQNDSHGGLGENHEIRCPMIVIEPNAQDVGIDGDWSCRKVARFVYQLNASFVGQLFIPLCIQ